jgi:hypothetical protein
MRMRERRGGGAAGGGDHVRRSNAADPLGNAPGTPTQRHNTTGRGPRLGGALAHLAEWVRPGPPYARGLACLRTGLRVRTLDCRFFRGIRGGTYPAAAAVPFHNAGGAAGDAGGGKSPTSRGHHE